MGEPNPIASGSAFAANSTLDSLQARQFEHDQKYHPEIVSLGTQRRMTHVALHLAKYLAVLTKHQRGAEFERAITDAFIMVTSASNLLGLRLSQLVGSAASPLSHDSFIQAYIEVLSDLAKACEAADHLEDFPINRVWKASISKFIGLIGEMSASTGIDIVESSKQRLNDVENKHGLQFVLESM